MHLDSEWTLFWITYLASALTALSPVLLSNKPLTLRLLVGTVVLYGGLGSGFGMTVGYEYLGGKQHPLRVILYGMLVGAGAIKKKDITSSFKSYLTFGLKSILGVLDNGGSDKPKKADKPQDTHDSDDKSKKSDKQDSHDKGN